MGTQEQTLKITEANKVLTLTYSGALDFHAGQSWFGVAVGFRMLQAASKALSEFRLWHREDLFVVSCHPGSGVRDVVEYVTHCVSRERYQVRSDSTDAGCNRAMQFSWEVGDGLHIAAVHLRDDFVPELLYQLLDRCGTSHERADDQVRFAQLKRQLAEQTWNEPLERLFNLDLLEAGLTGHA